MGISLPTAKWGPILARAEAIALVLTAVLARTLFPDASFFTSDQMLTVEHGHAVLAGHWLTPGASIGWSTLKLGPLYSQVAALGLIPRDRFSDVVVLLGVLNGASVLGWRRVLGRIDGAPLARLGAWALALSPVAVCDGSAPNHYSLVAPTTLLFVWGIERWAAAGARWGFALACIGAALMVQAHITTVLLLPLFLVGMLRRAPIGRVGTAGLCGALLIAAPMILLNAELLLRDPEGLRHAGTEGGAPFLVGLMRAGELEARVAEIGGLASEAWRARVYATSLLWSVIALVGAAAFVRSRLAGVSRWLLVCGLVIPTVAIAMIPRGALFYYLDCTLPFRCLLFAAGVRALMRSGRAIPRTGFLIPMTAAILAAIAAIGPTAGLIAARREVLPTGVLRVNMSAVDLREPTGRPSAPIAILSLASQRALGRALDQLGADPASLDTTVHGPWRWAMMDSTSVWVAASARDRERTPGLAPQARPAAKSFLVLYDEDQGILTPASTPVLAGRFRVYPFDDLVSARNVEGDRLEIGMAGDRPSPAVVQIITDAAHGVRRAETTGAEVAITQGTSSSGFTVWHTVLDSEPASLILDFEQVAERGPMARSFADAYAFRRADALPMLPPQ